MDKKEQLQQLEQERHETMVKLVYASQAAYAELEQAKAAYAAVKRYRFLKRRKAKQAVIAGNVKMAQLEHSIQAAHEKYQQGLQKLEA